MRGLYTGIYRIYRILSIPDGGQISIKCHVAFLTLTACECCLTSTRILVSSYQTQGVTIQKSQRSSGVDWHFIIVNCNCKELHRLCSIEIVRGPRFGLYLRGPRFGLDIIFVEGHSLGTINATRIPNDPPEGL